MGRFLPWQLCGGLHNSSKSAEIPYPYEKLQADRLIVKGHLQLHSSEPGAPPAAPLGAPAPPCRSTESWYPFICKDLDRFEAVCGSRRTACGKRSSKRRAYAVQGWLDAHRQVRHRPRLVRALPTVSGRGWHASRAAASMCRTWFWMWKWRGSSRATWPAACHAPMCLRSKRALPALP